MAGRLVVSAEALPAKTNREKVLALEAKMRELPQVEIETIHHFAPGVYAREIRIPAGVLLTGMIHRTEHLSIISKGRMTVVSANAPKIEIEAPYTLLSKPGAKRAIYAHTDSVWTCIHPTTETDLDKLEELFIAPCFEALGD